MRTLFPSTVGYPFSIWSRLLYNRAKNVIKNFRTQKNTEADIECTSLHTAHIAHRTRSTLSPLLTGNRFVVFSLSKLVVHLANTHEIKVQRIKRIW